MGFSSVVSFRNRSNKTPHVLSDNQPLDSVFLLTKPGPVSVQEIAALDVEIAAAIETVSTNRFITHWTFHGFVEPTMLYLMSNRDIGVNAESTLYGNKGHRPRLGPIRADHHALGAQAPGHGAPFAVRPTASRFSTGRRYEGMACCTSATRPADRVPEYVVRARGVAGGLAAGAGPPSRLTPLRRRRWCRRVSPGL